MHKIKDQPQFFSMQGNKKKCFVFQFIVDPQLAVLTKIFLENVSQHLLFIWLKNETKSNSYFNFAY